MRVWGLLCLLSCITTLNAHDLDVTDESDNIEDRSSVGIVPHIGNKSHTNNSSKKSKAERSSADQSGSLRPGRVSIDPTTAQRTRDRFRGGRQFLPLV